MRLDAISKHTRALVMSASAIIALGALTACSSGTPVTTATSATTGVVAAMPAKATFIAEMPAAQGAPMTTMAITVEGEKVVAYATNGTNNEAYFFGTQKDGQMDVESMYADHLKASFDGQKVSGVIVMNENGASPEKFAASPVAAPAGIYTAAHGSSRATWVVRPDHAMVGVMDNSAPGDHKVTDAIAAQDQQFKDKVRQMRLDRQMRPAPQMTYGTWSMDMHGKTVTAVPVTGDMTF
jgi:hypothetical protein